MLGTTLCESRFHLRINEIKLEALGVDGTSYLEGEKVERSVGQVKLL